MATSLGRRYSFYTGELFASAGKSQTPLSLQSGEMIKDITYRPPESREWAAGYWGPLDAICSAEKHPIDMPGAPVHSTLTAVLCCSCDAIPVWP